MIEISTLGSGLIQRDGVTIVEITPKSQKCALLLYLAMEGPVSRDRLLRIFWPGRDPAKARHALSQALYSLRRELGDDCLKVEGDTVYLCPELVHLDAKELEAAEDAGSWERMLRLYRGPFLEKFSLTGFPDFDAWCNRTRARISGKINRAFNRALEASLDAGDRSGALATATRWVELRPLEDEARHALINLLALSGDRKGALEQYADYSARLSRELGAEPLAETKELVERIRAGDRPSLGPLTLTDLPDATSSEGRPSSADQIAPEGAGRRDWRRSLRALRRGLPWKIGALYLAGAWLAIQAADTLVDRQILADWVFRFVLLAAIFGFPIALIVAWSREAAPRREVAASQPPTHGSALVRAKRILGPALAVLGALIIGLLSEFLADEWLPRRTSDPAVAPETAEPQLNPSRVVILPFNDLSLDREFERLTLGLTDRLITELNQHDELVVIPLSAALPLLQSGVTQDSLARYLRAGTLVEGNISASQEQIRVDVKLIDPSILAPTAIDSVFEARGELLALFDQLLRDVSRILSTKLGLTLRDRERRASTESDEAWELYLMARQAAGDAKEWRLESPEVALRGYELADSLLAAAEDIDPEWLEPILERGWLAESRADILKKLTRVRDPDMLLLGIDHAERVLEREPESARALELRGTLRYWLHLGVKDSAAAASLFRGAEDDLARAVNLDPESALAWQRLSQVYREQGRFDKAKDAAERALKADEFLEERELIFERICHYSLELKQWDEVTRWCGEGRTRYYPENRGLRNTELVALAGPEGPEPDVDLAWRLQSEFIELTPRDEIDLFVPPSLLWVAGVLARAGHPDSARSVVERARALSKLNDPMLDYYEANVRLQLGETEKALALLRQYLDALPNHKTYLARDWWWERLHDSPAWRALVE
ncbi:MAG: tetratricopeptide repeat protein [Gemmatimonadota bacterium]|nr:MAG: tetratricopeptide repeat protein [Gemmatimonadota bacterium]